MARILIVDDSKTSRKFLRNMLEQAGHEIVAEAVDGAEGVEKFKIYIIHSCPVCRNDCQFQFL